jgi:hypothetical protein
MDSSLSLDCIFIYDLVIALDSQPKRIPRTKPKPARTGRADPRRTITTIANTQRWRSDGFCFAMVSPNKTKLGLGCDIYMGSVLASWAVEKHMQEGSKTYIISF